MQKRQKQGEFHRDSVKKNTNAAGVHKPVVPKRAAMAGGMSKADVKRGYRVTPMTKPAREPSQGPAHYTDAYEA